MIAARASRVEVASGRILVRPTFADLLACQKVPGGRWDAASKAWSFPATQENASLLWKALHHATTTPEFSALLAAQPLPPKPEPPIRVPQVIEQPDPVIQVQLPDGLLTIPWRHQIAAFKFCLEKFAAGMRGVLLACGMGVGKSLVACMLVLTLGARRVLIACPLRVVQVWISQFERHVGVPVVIVALDEETGSVAKKRDRAAEKMKLAETLGRPFIAVINYDSAWREPFATWAEKQKWDLVICDEQHRIKAVSGKASLSFKRLRKSAAYRIGLTGTPMPHGPLDIYAQFRFLDISIFGPSFSAFRQRYAVMGGFQRKQITGFQRLDELEKLMAQITFRVGKEVLDLPPETHVTYYCDLAGEAARIYKDLEEDFVAQVLDGIVTAANALVKLLRLQQVTGGCIKTDEGIERRIDTAKLKLLADTLEDMGQDEPVVVFCRFHADLDAVHEASQGLGYTSLELSGRRDELARWQAGEAQVLAAQISSGGVGVDLTRARYSIFFSLTFSLGEYDQALARVHRPGQTRPVTHVHLLARGTVDEKIQKALERRAEVINAILSEIRS